MLIAAVLVGLSIAPASVQGTPPGIPPFISQGHTTTTSRIGVEATPSFTHHINVTDRLSDHRTANDINYCMTEECVKLASHLLQNMNQDVDPCEDFHEYVCGNFEERFDLIQGTNSFMMAIPRKVKRILRLLLQSPETFQSAPSKKAAALYKTCLREAELDYQSLRSELGDNYTCPRDQTSEGWCVDKIMEAIPMIISKLFIDSHLTSATIAEVEGIFLHVKQATEAQIRGSTSVDEFTKTLALEKLKSMKYWIGYNANLDNDTKLMEVFENVDPGSGFMAQYEQLLWNGNKTNHKTRKIRDFLEPNALYNPRTNEVLIMGGMLMFPIFAQNVPKYFSYGSIGEVSGHEIGHSFTPWEMCNVNISTTYRVSEKEYNQIHSSTECRFWHQSNCIRNHFQNLVDTETNATLNGHRLWNENLADLLGRKTAFKAYKSLNAKMQHLPGLAHLSHDQLFFVAASAKDCEVVSKSHRKERITEDMYVHPLGMYRTMEPLRHMEEFSQAFGCKPKSYMNPADKCTVF